MDMDTSTKSDVEVALDFARSYSGSFGFMQKMREAYEQNKNFSENMIASILRCKTAEDGYAARQAKAAEARRLAGRGTVVDATGAPRAVNQTDIDLNVLPEGRLYAAVDGPEQTEFLKFDRIKSTARKWVGWTFVKRQYGDNWERLGVQRPNRFDRDGNEIKNLYTGGGTALIKQVLDDPFAAAQRYGRELGHCGMCNKSLTDDDSRARGIGPECWTRKFGKGPSQKMDRELGIQPVASVGTGFTEALASLATR